MYGHPEFAMHVKAKSFLLMTPEVFKGTAFSMPPATVVDVTSEVT